MEKWEIKRFIVLGIEKAITEYQKTHSLSETHEDVADVLSEIVMHPENIYDWDKEYKKRIYGTY